MMRPCGPVSSFDQYRNPTLLNIIARLFPLILFFAWLNSFEIPMAARMNLRGAYQLSLTRDELTLFGINRSSFEESTCIGTSSKLDEVLLRWFDDSSKRIGEYLSSYEAQKPIGHFCTPHPREKRRNCFYLSKDHHHVRRSQRCPDVSLHPEMFLDKNVKEAESQYSYADVKSSAWDSYRYLEAVAHDFESLTLQEPLPPNIMDLVMARAATREQLWVLEGVLYRQMHTASSAEHRDKFVCLWLVVYRAKRGVQAPYKAFNLSQEFSKRIAKIPVWVPPSEILYRCSEECVSLLLYISKLRARHWRNAADVLKGVEHSTERWPHGAARGEGGYFGEIPPVLGKTPGNEINDALGAIEEVD